MQRVRCNIKVSWSYYCLKLFLYALILNISFIAYSYSSEQMTIPDTLKKSRAISELTKEEASEELKYLAHRITELDKAYYLDNMPLVTDAQYDALRLRNEQIEAQFPQLKLKESPTDKVSGEVQEKFGKITHVVPMLSLSNCFNKKELSDFVDRVAKILVKKKIGSKLEFVCEPKIDGLSFSAMYENGKLKNGSTRGDGLVGEDITNNLKTIEGFPHEIDTSLKNLEIRGEIFMTRKAFDELNKERLEQKGMLFANPRNAAAGSLRQLDAKITASRKLDYFVYSLGESADEFASSQQEALEKMRALGFRVTDLYKKVDSVDELEKYKLDLYSNREKIPYDIDGVVFKVNDFAQQKVLGFIARAPRFAIAYKFPSLQAETIVNEIVIQIGRTGALTPVAELEPVNIGGVIVRRATLHNREEIRRKDIRAGDKVIVERSGDVIPKVVSVKKDERKKDAPEFVFPQKCPVCSSPLVIEGEGMITRCPGGLKCQAQKVERLEHFVSRNAFDIEGLGQENIRFLHEHKFIDSPADIFRLSAKQGELKTHEGWGEKSVSNLLESIEDRKEISLNRFIYALGIRHIGETNALILARHYETFENFENNMQKIVQGDAEAVKEFLKLEGLGIKALEAIKIFFKDEYLKIIVKDLAEILQIKSVAKKVVQTDNPLSNKKIVFTGAISMSRDEAKELAENQGAKVSSSVSSQTDILVAGENAGSKLENAKKLGVKIISEDEFKKMLQNN